jgi:DNA-binding MarR family transcriptional regulator
MIKTNNTDLRSQLSSLILKAEWHMSNQLNVFLKQRGGRVSPAAWLVLESLSDGEGMSMSSLCGVTRANDSTLTKIVDKLVNDSLVYRKPDRNDRRKVLVYRSKRGSELYTKLKGQVEDSYKDAFPEYSDEQAMQLVDQLESMMIEGYS